MCRDNTREPVYLPSSALLGILVTIESLFLTLYSFLGSEDHFKQYVCSIISAVAALFLLTVGRRALRGHWPLPHGRGIGLTAGQAVWVTCFVIAGGLFYYWMFNE
jgi:hypothetical protein